MVLEIITRNGANMAGAVPATTRRRVPSGTISLVLGIMALFGMPAGPLIWLAGSKPPAALLLIVTVVQLLVAVGAVSLGLMSKPVGVPGHRPPSAWAGIAIGGLSLALNTILAVALTFNYVGNSMDRSVIETDPIILQPAD
jgi:hypothetical protein